jgi:hypothetical protein
MLTFGGEAETAVEDCPWPPGATPSLPDGGGSDSGAGKKVLGWPVPDT